MVKRGLNPNPRTVLGNRGFGGDERLHRATLCSLSVKVGMAEAEARHTLYIECVLVLWSLL